MKKSIIIAAISAASAILLAASCQKQEEPEIKDEGKTFTAVIDQELTKTTITSEYKVNWDEGDQIDINGGTTYSATPNTSDATKATFTKVSGSDPDGEYGYTAVYPASLFKDSGYELPAAQTCVAGKFNAPMCAMSDTESLEFKNFCGVLCFALKGTDKVRSIAVTANEQLCGPFEFMDATAICFTGENEGYTVTLDCGTEGIQLNETTATNFYIYLPQNEYAAGMKMTITNTDGEKYEKTTTKTAKISRSNIYTFNWTPSFAPVITVGALSGKFTINEDGRQVSFAQGNLICDISGETPKWGFYQNQYGYAAGYSSTLISLFTWGYDPDWSIVANGTTNHTQDNLGGNNYLSQEKDWGSQIGDGNTWRTLTMEEWKYLFEDRVNAADKYGYATVGGVYGIIILPDSFTDPMKNGGSGAFVTKTTTGWNANVYTTGGNWEAMEAAGAVFLPAAGSRSGSSLSYVGDYGYYWSSSYDTNSGPYGLTFYSSLVNPDASGDVATGKSVRLVTDLYTVTFDMNGKIGTAPESLKGIPYGSTITKPSDPNAEGYAFTGWYKDATYTEAWDFSSDKVTSNVTLYAKWFEGALSGKFTVNENGEQVFFSKGNLWCDQNGTFNFEANQYDYTVRWDGGATYRSDEHVSHFIWCTDASIARALECGTDPLVISTVLFTNSDETHPNPDFTVNGQKGVWRTLSNAEWTYLVNHNGSLWTSINGVNGLIIFSNEYKGMKTDLTEIPEGCVFLPAAGYRYATPSSYGPYPVDNVDKIGHYWSSTPEGPVDPVDAYNTSFNSSGIKFVCDIKGAVNSVRLVTEVVTE